MSRRTALQAFMVGAPLAFACLLVLHPMGTGDMYTAVSGDATRWLVVHYGAAVFFPLMALVVWLLVRDLSGRAATVARFALPTFAVFYTVWEVLFGIATGIIANAGNTVGDAQREGTTAAFDAIINSPLVGESGVFVSVGSLAWWTGISAAILALRHAGVRPAALVLLGLGGLMAFHVLVGPVALVCLSGAAYLIERRRAPVHAESLSPVPAA